MVTSSQALTDEGHLSLAQIIEQSVDVASKLFDTLEQERTVLAGAQHEALEPVFSRKSDLAGHLTQLDRRRAAWVAKHGDAAVSAHPLWERYCYVLERCREANAINGRLVQDRQRHVRRALGILRGQVDDEAELYSQRGAAVPGAQSQTLGSA